MWKWEIDCGLTFPLYSLIEPPGVGSWVPAPRRENTSTFSSRDVIRRNADGDTGMLLPLKLVVLEVVVPFVSLSSLRFFGCNFFNVLLCVSMIECNFVWFNLAVSFFFWLLLINKQKINCLD